MFDAETIGSFVSGGVITGVLTAVGSLVKARTSGRVDTAAATATVAKLPGEVVNVNLAGAEAAVLTMRSALESAHMRIQQLDATAAADRVRIAELEEQLRIYRQKAEAAEQMFREAQAVGAELATQLEQFRVEQDARARRTENGHA